MRPVTFGPTRPAFTAVEGAGPLPLLLSGRDFGSALSALAIDLVAAPRVYLPILARPSYGPRGLASLNLLVHLGWVRGSRRTADVTLDAGVAELVDALDLGSSGASRGGSSPSARTIPGASGET